MRRLGRQRNQDGGEDYRTAKSFCITVSTQKRRFAQFKEDGLGFWLTKYNVPRMLTIERTNPETR